MTKPNSAVLHKKLKDLTPDSRNANKGTPRGNQMIEDSLRQYGAGRSILLWPQNPLQGDEDEVPPVPVEPKSKLGDLYILGNHRLLCGDSTKREDVERLMGGQKADCVFTSPPYAVGVDYGGYQDDIEHLRVMLPLLAQLWLGWVAAGGFAVINFGDIAAGSDVAGTKGPCECPMALEYWPVFRNAGWVLWSRRVWCKPNPRVRSLQCIGSNRAATDWEHIWTWKAPGQPIVKRVDGISPNGWFDTTRDHGVDIGKDTHGAGMAVAPAERMLSIHSRAHTVILEPFAGTGTTLIACEKTGRKCFMMELSAQYTDVICQRYLNATGKMPIKEDGTPWSEVK